MGREKVIIDNALVRCLREDREAEPLFELAQAEFGLWVWELPSSLSADAEAQLELIWRELERNRSRLIQLADGSREYVLFLSIATTGAAVMRVPHKLTCLMAECGMELEIFPGSGD